MYRILNANGEALPGAYATAEEAQQEAQRLRTLRKITVHVAEEYTEGYVYLPGEVLQLTLF